MNGQIDLVTLLTLIVAVVAIFKLRSVLGRRTDDDDARIENRLRELKSQRVKSDEAVRSEKVVTLRPREAKPEQATEPVDTAEAEDRLRPYVAGDDSVLSGLVDILKADEQFDPERFLRGARVAYEIIITAYAEGSRKALRDLVAPDVGAEFEAAIAEREKSGHRIERKFVGINKADIVGAELDKKGIASITVRFLSQLISATYDKSGQMIDGDPSKVTDVTDIWTFARDVATPKARMDPNWSLVST